MSAGRRGLPWAAATLSAAILASALPTALQPGTSPHLTDLVLPGLEVAPMSSGQTPGPTVGLTPLLFALLALVGDRGWPARLLQVVTLAAVLACTAGVGVPVAGPLLVISVAILAGRGLQLPGRPAWPWIGVAITSVLLAMVLVSLAAQAGATTAREVVDRFCPQAAGLDPGWVAARTRAVLDRAAVAAFAAMAVLLTHGRHRNTWTAWLVVLIGAADLFLWRAPTL